MLGIKLIRLIQFSFSSDKILLTPKEKHFDGNVSYFVYDVMHSSGNKPKKELLEAYHHSEKKSNNILYSRYGDEAKFMEIMKEYKHMYGGTLIKDKFTRLVVCLERNQYDDYIKGVYKIKEDILYIQAKKLYYPNVFADYRPTKKQITRNREAKSYEAKGEYDKAMKLYEENIAEKTGSSTSYKKLIKFYFKSKDYYRVIEIMNIAIPIFFI